MEDNTNYYTDEYCRKGTNPSELSMQAHSAPLGIVFYNFTESLPNECVGGGQFPKKMDGFAFVAFHGSWNRDPPTGYKVVFIPMNEQGFVPEGEEAHDLLKHNGTSSAAWDSGYRPVDVDFDECGRLIVSSDGSRGVGSNIVRISYQGAEVVSPVLEPSNPTPVPPSNPTTEECCGSLPDSSSTRMVVPPPVPMALLACILFLFRRI